MIFWAALLLIPAIAFGMSKPPPEPVEGLDYVYTSIPRLLNPERTLLQEASDVANINANFVESDIEMIDADGRVTVIYDCTKSDVVCAAQESKVSPNGEQIAFSVSFGNALVQDQELIQKVLTADLFVYNTITGKTVKVPGTKAGTINRMPDWINDNTLVYASNEADYYSFKNQCSLHGGKYPDGRYRQCNGVYGVSQNYGYGPEAKAMQIWRINIDGTDKRNLTPHEANAIKPIVLKNPRHEGRILFSTHQEGEDKAFYGPSHSGNRGTNINLWWLASIDQNGADQTIVLGGHNSPFIPNSKYLEDGWSGGQQEDKFLALRAAGENADGDIFVTSYYRRNHYGLGNTYRFQILRHSIEGCSTLDCYADSDFKSDRPGSAKYIPFDLIPISPYAVGQDISQRFDARGRVMGKTGFPNPLPNGNILITQCWGWCYLPHTQADVDKVTAGGQPLRDEGLYEVFVPMVTDPFDPHQMIKLVDDPAKLERDGQAIIATATPPQTPPLTGDKCYLNIVDVTKAELSPSFSFTQYRDLGFLTALQGNAVRPDSKHTAKELDDDPTLSRFNSRFHANNIDAFAISYADLYEYMHPDPRFVADKNYMGIQKTYPPYYARPKDDGSLSMEVECERPFKMSAVDSSGAQIAHDPMLQSLRPGENRTCYGCHDGHSVERAVFELGYKTPQELFSNTQASKSIPSKGAQEPDATWAQVQSILEKRCSGCHEGFNDDDGLLWDRVTADYEQLDWAWIPRQIQPNGDYKILRACFSQMVCRYARWSTLYWAAMGQRMDGFTNETFTDDFDIPVDHPKATTDAEARKIAVWIGLGAPN